ncbi:ferredoxin reductase [Amnibacterium setariae]|uniref:ferredoxin reductase n=1 Tax=Amnibacterium setariae TaxID=2306585 RepID=UPI0018F69792|nr:ferredoxin reductase [Amnibacterium setariae]
MTAVVVGETRETATARALRFSASGLRPALAGQHIDIRLTAEDGYTAQRSYSLSSAAGADPIEVTVERFEDGEVSPYLVDGVAVGDAVEVRGPIGGWLVWRPSDDRRPVQLIAGGSGVAPLMSMLRTREAARSTVPFRLLYGVTDPDRVYYRDELDRIAADGVQVDLRYSRRVPEGSPLHAGRLTRDDLAALVVPPAEDPSVFVCGPTGFVEAVSDALLALGHPEERIRTERFGPTS